MEMENLSSYSTKNKKKKRKYKKKTWFSRLSKKGKAIFISSICVICAAVIAIPVAVFLKTFDYNHAPLDENELGVVSALDAGVINIALFGVDTREPGDFTGRSDSIMILSIDSRNDKVKITSVMRDSFVPIKDSYGKINSAYSQGGPTLAVKTLNTIFGLDIRDYATVNFFGMEDIIDAVGGVEIEVMENEIEGDYKLNALVYEQAIYQGVEPVLVKKAGLQTLSGMQAVAWARIRYASTASGTTDDFGRTDRQRVVMNALFNKALNMSTSNYPKLIKALLPYTQTSLTYSEIIKLAGIFVGGNVTFEEMRIAMPEYIINADYRPYGESCVYYNLDYASKLIHAFIYDGIAPEDYMQTNGVDKTDWYGYSGSYGGSGSGYVGNSDSDGDTNSDTSGSGGGMTIIGGEETPSETSSEESSLESGNEESSETESSESQESSETQSGTQETSSTDTTTSE